MMIERRIIYHFVSGWLEEWVPAKSWQWSLQGRLKDEKWGAQPSWFALQFFRIFPRPTPPACLACTGLCKFAQIRLLTRESATAWCLLIGAPRWRRFSLWWTRAFFCQVSLLKKLVFWFARWRWGWRWNCFLNTIVRESGASRKAARRVRVI